MMKKVPKRRFKGFLNAGDWEQRKLGDLTPLRGGFAFKSTEFKETGVPVIRISNILSDGSIGGDFAYYLEQNNDENYVLPNNALVIAMSGATTGKAAVLKNTGNIKFYQNQRVGYFQNNLKCDYSFISTLVKSSIFLKQLESVLVAGAQPNISSKEIDSFIFKIPISTDEQRKISKLFNMIDSTITLHQRKLEKLQATKKALLYELFPIENSRRPKRRFKGFTGDWEQRKLADVANIIMGQSPSSQNYTDNPNDNILVQGNADLIDGQVVPRLWTKEITKSIDAGNIVMTVRAPVGDVAKTAYKVVLGRGVAGIKGDEYIYQFLLKLKYNHYWRSLSSGSTFESINSNDIKNLIIDIPCDEERTKIRNLLSTTDTLITLHQRKLEKLKNLKAAYLNEMFV